MGRVGFERAAGAVHAAARDAVSRPEALILAAGIVGAAGGLGVSLETVRTRLARCFDATGARNQAALAALVARLPRSEEDRRRTGP